MRDIKYSTYVDWVIPTGENGWRVNKEELQVGMICSWDAIRFDTFQINGCCITLRKGLNTVILISENTEAPAKPIKRW